MKSNEKGFTLIEVMVVLLIIGVIMAIAVPNMSNAGAKAHEKGCEANQRLIRSQLENYKLEKGDYPAGADSTAIFTELKGVKLLKEDPDCPAGGSYVFLVNEITEVSTSSSKAINVTCDHADHDKLGE